MALSYCKALWSIQENGWLHPAWVSYTKLHPPSCSQSSDFALPMNLKAAKWPTVCPSICGGPQFCTIWTNTDLRQSLFFHLLCLSILGKVPAPSFGLTLLEKVLTKEDTSFVILHFELTWKCLKSFWHLTQGFILSSDRTSWVECGPTQSWWKLDLSWTPPTPIPDQWILHSHYVFRLWNETCVD